MVWARIRGAGTETIRIDGVTKLTSVEHTVIPDRIVADISDCWRNNRGRVVVQNVIKEHLDAVIAS